MSLWQILINKSSNLLQQVAQAEGQSQENNQPSERLKYM